MEDYKMNVEKRMTWGNVLSTVITILTGAAIVVTGVTALNNTNAATKQNKRGIARLETEMSQVQTSVQTLQVNSARVNAQYESLSRLLNEMRGELREIRNLLRSERQGGR